VSGPTRLSQLTEQLGNFVGVLTVFVVLGPLIVGGIYLFLLYLIPAGGTAAPNSSGLSVALMAGAWICYLSFWLPATILGLAVGLGRAFLPSFGYNHVALVAVVMGALILWRPSSFLLVLPWDLALFDRIIGPHKSFVQNFAAGGVVMLLCLISTLICWSIVRPRHG
jgi:hypothetical protein